MATIKLGRSQEGGRLINYAEKRAEVKSGVNCSADYARAQMKATRELWGKPDGVQAHHVIQSFKPDEISAEKANQLGQELAEKIAPGHEVAVYTHTDKAHIHNHIVINAVNFENGRKYQAHGQKAIEDIRQASDDLCRQHELSLVDQPAKVRHTLAEQALLEKGQDSWKDEIRQAIDISKSDTSDFDSFKKHLELNYGVETKLRGKTLSFRHPERERFVRANKLGADYEMEGLERGFAREVAAGKAVERDSGRNAGAEQAHDKLYQGSDERGHGEGHDDRQPVRSHQEQQQRSSGTDELSLEQARQFARSKQRKLAEGFDRWTAANSGEQPADGHETGRDRGAAGNANQRDQHQNEQQHERNREQNERPRRFHKGRDEGLSR